MEGACAHLGGTEIRVFEIKIKVRFIEDLTRQIQIKKPASIKAGFLSQKLNQ